MNKDEVNLCREVAPFVVFGAMGGFIKALNTKKCTWKDVLVKIFTGAFGGLIGGMWLMTTDYPILARYAMAGAIGVTVDAVYGALTHRLWDVIAGTQPDEEDREQFKSMGGKEERDSEEQ